VNNCLVLLLSFPRGQYALRNVLPPWIRSIAAEKVLQTIGDLSFIGFRDSCGREATI
jgi:hypothetical protein